MWLTYSVEMLWPIKLCQHRYLDEDRVVPDALHPDQVGVAERESDEGVYLLTCR